MSTSRSNRPNRRRAGSIELGCGRGECQSDTARSVSVTVQELTLLVAAMTTRLDRAFKPSINVKSWETTRLSTSPLVYRYQTVSRCSLHCTVYNTLRTHLLTLGSDRIDLVDENDGRAVLLGLFEGLSQVALRLSGHLGHDLGTVNQEKERSSLVGDSSCHQGLSCSRRSEHEDTSRRLDTDGLEKLRVSQRKLDQFSNLLHEREGCKPANFEIRADWLMLTWAICFLHPPMSSYPTSAKLDSSSSLFTGSPSQKMVYVIRKIVSFKLVNLLDSC
jgi:hypothetical protein